MLVSALNALIEGSLDQCNICFFIDGIDELEGKFHEREALLDLMSTLARRDKVKVLVSYQTFCILAFTGLYNPYAGFISIAWVLSNLMNAKSSTQASSRPELHLLEAFEQCPKLKLQDLTLGDMKSYASGKLLKHPRMEEFQLENKFQVETLVEKVTKKADGVFLWLYLAVSDLLRGLQKGNTLDELLKRLDGLDGELSGFFKQRIAEIDVVDRDRVAIILGLLMDTTRNHVSWSARERSRVSVLDIAFAIQHCDASATLQWHPDNVEFIKYFRSRLAETQNIILRQCAGLVDIKGDCYEPFSESCKCIPWRRSESEIQLFFDMSKLFGHYDQLQLVMIHGSAFDFLNDPKETDTFLSELPRSLDDTYSSNLLAHSGRAAAWLACALKAFRIERRKYRQSDLDSQHELDYASLSFDPSKTFLFDVLSLSQGTSGIWVLHLQEAEREIETSFDICAEAEREVSDSNHVHDALVKLSRWLPSSLTWIYQAIGASDRDYLEWIGGAFRIARGRHLPQCTFLPCYAARLGIHGYMTQQILSVGDEDRQNLLR